MSELDWMMLNALPDLEFAIEPQDQGGWDVIATDRRTGIFFLRFYIPDDLPRRWRYYHQDEIARAGYRRKELGSGLILALQKRIADMRPEPTLAALYRARCEFVNTGTVPQEYRLGSAYLARIIETEGWNGFQTLSLLAQGELWGIPFVVDTNLPPDGFVLVARKTTE